MRLRLLTSAFLVSLTAATSAHGAPLEAEEFAAGFDHIVNSADLARISRVLGAGSIGGDCPANIDWLHPIVSPMNATILGNARSHLGQQVGDGECSSLAVEAMSVARSRPFYQQGPSGADQDYVWGQYVGLATPSNRSLNNTVPGDILQLRNAKIQVNYGNRYTVSNYPHHTAVVSAVSRDHTKVCVLEQNYNNIRKVRYSYYDLSGLQTGWIKSFRPVAQ